MQYYKALYESDCSKAITIDNAYVYILFYNPLRVVVFDKLTKIIKQLPWQQIVKVIESRNWSSMYDNEKYKWRH